MKPRRPKLHTCDVELSGWEADVVGVVTLKYINKRWYLCDDVSSPDVSDLYFYVSLYCGPVTNPDRYEIREWFITKDCKDFYSVDGVELFYACNHDGVSKNSPFIVEYNKKVVNWVMADGGTIIPEQIYAATKVIAKFKGE